MWHWTRHWPSQSRQICQMFFTCLHQILTVHWSLTKSRTATALRHLSIYITIDYNNVICSGSIISCINQLQTMYIKSSLNAVAWMIDGILSLGHYIQHQAVGTALVNNVKMHWISILMHNCLAGCAPFYVREVSLSRPFLPAEPLSTGMSYQLKIPWCSIEAHLAKISH